MRFPIRGSLKDVQALLGHRGVGDDGHPRRG